MKNIQLSEHFSYRKLFRFTLPSIAMMIFTSIYGVVDGLFVSNFVGKTSFAAVNFIMLGYISLFCTDAVSADFRNGWIYVWYGRQRFDCKNVGRRKRR